MAKILVIDDEAPIRKTLAEILKYESFDVETAADGIEGLEKMANKTFDLVLLDIKMPKMDGMEVLEEIFKLFPGQAVVMISGHGTVENAVEAIKKGAFDFIQKPLDLNRLLVTIKNATEKSKLIEEHGVLVKETKALKRKVKRLYEMVGQSAPISRVKDMIERVADTDARVLITGANGTGKELVARSLHEGSARINAPFVEVNCAAIPSELIESELFGHEKGSFTSAHKQRKGKFELAHGGTLFLDEIGDMSLSAQAKVLRALQERKISRVGGDKQIEVDVRVIAATNKDLQAEIKAHNFREDLYHRLSVILIEVPPLKDRADDIPELADYFIAQVAEEHGMTPKTISPDALEYLQKLSWTGNIREFRNVIERLMILCGAQIMLDDVKKYVVS